MSNGSNGARNTSDGTRGRAGTSVREAVIVAGWRTPFGKRGGQFSNWHPVEMLSFTLKALIERTGIDPTEVEDVIGGCVGQVGEQALNVTRNAWLDAGLPESTPATTVDRQCGSGLQAVQFAAQGVMAGGYDLVVACGVENMSRVPLGSQVAQHVMARPEHLDCAVARCHQLSFFVPDHQPDGVRARLQIEIGLDVDTACQFFG